MREMCKWKSSKETDKEVVRVRKGQKVDEKKVKEAIEFLQRKIRTLDAQKEYDEYCNPVHNETLDLAIGLYEQKSKRWKSSYRRKLEKMECRMV